MISTTALTRKRRCNGYSVNGETKKRTLDSNDVAGIYYIYSAAPHPTLTRTPTITLTPHPHATRTATPTITRTPTVTHTPKARLWLPIVLYNSAG